MKKRRISHPDEEDPGTICALLGAMKVNVWGGEEHYIFRQSGTRRGKVGRQGPGEEGKEEEGGAS